MVEIIKKKRGRKPKNINNLLLNNKQIINEDIVISEEEKIILHLPISMNQLNNNDDMLIFMKNEEVPTKSSSNSESSDVLLTSYYNNTIYNNVNKITTHNLNFNKNTKCWWCRNTFDTPAVQLPEDYFNDTFYCIGNFCSFNCTKSYNLDSSDSLLSSKRESLLNLLYYQTYSEHKDIMVAPHWVTLKEYGGTLSIMEFRKNVLTNNKEYLILHPPLVSRQMQIEESYKLHKLKAVPLDTVNKLYSDIDSEYSIKRNKPIQSNQLNLETTMGLIKGKHKLK